MRITIFAATGGIGRCVLDQAVAAGHEVTAVVRDPGRVPSTVHTVRADLSTVEPGALEAAVGGADAVLSGLGPRNARQAKAITSSGTKAIIDAMKATGTRRIVVVSAAPVSTTPSPERPNPPRHDPAEGFLMRNVLTPIVRRVLHDHYADLAIMEDALRASGLDWTSVRPPKLTDKPLTGRYRVAYEQNIHAGPSISRADVAHYMLACLDDPTSIGHCVGIAT
ncbi:NAD(P)-dependent oxidoreductase [Kutzneria sp. NPDC052558]|uniref:NAD(P)-dependent oxidoreductase n=1 Tax=Kutzneria sp. NPDC052558 TaxID=3364121 RepID=UPI0037C93A2D